MDNEQLRPCPFCGEIAEVVSMLRNDLVRCGNPNCFASRLGFQHSDNWNTRPIEDALRAELAAVRDEYLSAAALVANMHKAALGEVTGPVLGVVEDVANVRAEVARLQAELTHALDNIEDYKAVQDWARTDYEKLQAELQQTREALKTILAIPLSEADYFDDISTGYHAGVSSCKKIASAALPTPPEQEATE